MIFFRRRLKKLLKKKTDAYIESLADLQFLESKFGNKLNAKTDKLRQKLAKAKQANKPEEAETLSNEISQIEGINRVYEKTSQISKELAQYIGLIKLWIKKPQTFLFKNKNE